MALLTRGKKDGKQIFIWEGTYEDRMLPKQAKFRWDPDHKRWWTSDATCAVLLEQFADTKARNLLKKFKQTLEDSRATDADIDIPSNEGLKYMAFQKGGINYALQREGTLIGDEMGLGKTIQAIGLINGLPSLKKILVICPASLKQNWVNELNKWLVHPYSVVAQGVKGKKERYFLEADIIVINYEVLKKYHDEIHSTNWDLLIVDECHYLKNNQAQRTQEVVGCKPWDPDHEDFKPTLQAKRRVFLTGTPILNRPIELWPVINYLDPEGWRSFWFFVKRYCNAFQTKYGWDMTGASNRQELQDKLRGSVMVRRLKEEVLKELPPKTRQLIPVRNEISKAKLDEINKAFNDVQNKYIDAQAEYDAARDSGDHDAYLVAANKLHSVGEASFTEISAIRKLIANAKIPVLTTIVENAIESHKVVVFVWHHDVAHALQDAFKDQCVVVTGETPVNGRQALVDRFQNDPETKVFIGSIKAAGVGFTLTASSHVIFGEIDWVPANITQAEDRCHRIGQEDNVLVQHLVIDGTLDVNLVKSIVDKQEVITDVLDEQNERNHTMQHLFLGISKGKPEPPKERDYSGINLDENDIDIIHMAVKIIASYCDGAFAEDGQGYNRYDAGYGRSLSSFVKLNPYSASKALKMVYKYKGQMDEDLIEELDRIRAKLKEE